MLAYWNSFSGPFVFLDLPAIVDNPTIRHLWPLGPVLNPPVTEGITVGGRPLVNLTFALNYAAGGLDVRGYHLANLLIHLLAALTLWDLARRTCRLIPSLALAGERVAWAVALLWTVHPLQTESVTYLVQRAESLMGLFYLLTLYCFVRSTDPTSSGGSGSGTRRAFRDLTGKRRLAACLPESGGPPLLPPIWWYGLTVLCCLLGMATKEVMVSAPVIVFLYDRTFVAHSWQEAWRRRKWFYAALAATWIPLFFLVAGTGGNRGGTAGFGIGVSVMQYLPTQFPAVLHYLRLVIWPYPLNFYYPVHWVEWSRVVPSAVICTALAGGALFAAWRGLPLGFCAMWFFAILAPTSLVPGASQTMAEHRMYLALAPLLSVCVVLLNGVGGARPPGALEPTAFGPEQPLKPARPEVALHLSDSSSLALRRNESLGGFRYPSIRSGWAGWQRFWLCLVLAAAGGLIALTIQRNRTYRSALVLWTDTANKSPDNPYVQNNLGIAQAAAGQSDAARASFTRALSLRADYPEAEDNLGLALAQSGQLPEAIGHYRRALQLKPRDPEALANLGVALASANQPTEALRALTLAVQLDPASASAHANLGTVFAGLGRRPEAIQQYQISLVQQPGNAEVHYDLANILAQERNLPEAILHYQKAIELRPTYVEALANLGATLASTGANGPAVTEYERALALTPQDPDIHYNLALALRSLGQDAEAARQFAEAEQLRAAQLKPKATR